MTDLRCEEVLDDVSEMEAELNNSCQNSPHFCPAYKDKAILDDNRVFRNMLELEEFYMPDANIYEDFQDEIKIHMRKIVAEWMLDVCVDQRCHVDVFLLATNVMDRFLATVKLQKKQFQLLGAASIFLASKMVEASPISALDLVKCTADTYDREELLSMELLILSKLKWDLTAITSYDYLDYMINYLPEKSCASLEGSSSSKIRRNTEKLVTLCATDETFMSMPPSLVAGAALITAIEQDNSNAASSGVNLNQIVACIQDIANIELACLKNCKHLMEKIFLKEDEPVSEASTSSGSASNTADQHMRPATRHYEASANQDMSGSDQATPTEVFSVSALYVT